MLAARYADACTTQYGYTEPSYVGTMATVIPVLAYPDVNEAAAWLSNAFGFSVRLRIGTHRVQMNVGDGAIIAREMRPGEDTASLGHGHSITVRIEDADA